MDMCQLVLGFLGRKAIIDGPIDILLRSHVYSLIGRSLEKQVDSSINDSEEN